MTAGATQGTDGMGLAMTTREQLRDMVTARPFRPYVITLADGESLTIRHPELVSCDTRGRDMQINSENGLVRVEMLVVVSMRQLEQPPSVEGDGARGAPC
jgi:hypothetical protein